jgi:hypothetical protein
MSCCLCLLFTVLATLRLRSDCAVVSHAAATHQPSHNSLLCVDTFHKGLVTQQYTATVHGALHASKFLVSLVRFEHSSSVHTVPELHRLLLVITCVGALGSPLPSARGHTSG